MLDIPGGAIPSRLKFQQIFAEQLEVLGKLFLLLIPFPILFFLGAGKGFSRLFSFPCIPGGFRSLRQLIPSFSSLSSRNPGNANDPEPPISGKAGTLQGQRIFIGKNPLEVQDFLKIRGKPKEGKYSGNIPIFPISCIFS